MNEKVGRSLAAGPCNTLQFGQTCSLPLGRNCPWRTPDSIPLFFSLEAGDLDTSGANRKVSPKLPPARNICPSFFNTTVLLLRPTRSERIQLTLAQLIPCLFYVHTVHRRRGRCSSQYVRLDVRASPDHHIRRPHHPDHLPFPQV